MPEGDTIYRAAAALRKAIEGQIVTGASSRLDGLELTCLIGQVVDSIEARGKHLLFYFDPSAQVLHSHMGMTGSWHNYRLDQTWQKPRAQAVVVLTTPRAVSVCFAPQTMEVLSQTQLRRHVRLRRLGPDILATVVDWSHILKRIRGRADRPVGELLLDQTVLCGIGNVYKSEGLFAERLNPFSAVSTFSDEQLKNLLEGIRRIMLRNLDGRPRRTRFRSDNIRQSVYGRQGEHCLHCGTTIKMRRQGTQGRSTYWCEACQPQSSGLLEE